MVRLPCRVSEQGFRFFTGDDPEPPGGIVWGNSRNALGAAALAAAVADFPGAPAYLKSRYGCLAASQLNYILGDTGRSFVVGFGASPPRLPHSREGFCRRDMPADTCSFTEFTNNALPNPNVRCLPLLLLRYAGR